MNIQKVDREIKLSQWIEIIRECRSSGQSVRSWYIEHNIKQQSYYYWLRKIREQACNSMGLPVSRDEEKCEFAQIQTSTTYQQVAPMIKLHIGEITIEISDGMSQDTISYVLNGIRNIC
jgi:predicted nucleotide-binding protein (sugar kinase/HSP70/actin superfamily)